MRAPIKLTCHWRQQLYISLQIQFERSQEVGAVWETKFFQHSPENRCHLHVLYKSPLARANFLLLTQLKMHSHWRVGERYFPWLLATCQDFLSFISGFTFSQGSHAMRARLALNASVPRKPPVGKLTFPQGQCYVRSSTDSSEQAHHSMMGLSCWQTLYTIGAGIIAMA